jgi:hypothetical protein
MIRARLNSALIAGVYLSATTALLSLPPFSIAANAQETTEPPQVESALAKPVIPQQVRFSATLPNRAGDTVEAVFRIYSNAEGGEPLWTETQKISVAQDGSYWSFWARSTPAACRNPCLEAARPAGWA